MPEKELHPLFLSDTNPRQINTIIEEAGVNTNIQVMSLFPCQITVSDILRKLG